MKLPFKKIDLSNWSDPDAASAGQAKGKDEKGWIHYTGEDYLEEIQLVRLSKNVPWDIYEQMELAKGICIYGIYFYPLFAVGMERAILTAGSATMLVCEKIGGPRKFTGTFENQIDWLTEQGAIDAKRKRQWHNVRKFRNTSSNPKHVTFMTPVMTLAIMERFAGAINSLFAAECDSK